MPSVAHPKKININGFIFEVVAYVSLTDEQALAIALNYCRAHKLKKRDVGKLIQIVTTFDEGSVGLL
jgi:hypothetical protein